MVELAGIGVGQCVLILGLGQSPADGDVLGRLHVEGDALDLGEPRLQPPDHLVGADVALIMGLQRDEDAAIVDRGGAAAGADRRPDRSDRRILQHRVDHGLLALGHGRIGDVLRRLGQADDQSGILLRKEALGNDDIEVAGHDDRAEHHHQRGEAMPQHDLEAGLVEVEQAVEAALRQADRAGRDLARCGLSRRAHIIGVSVSEISSESTSATLTVTANSWNS